MNIVNKLTIRHLKMNRSRTLITILGITLSVAMVCAVAGFVMSLREILHEMLVADGGDYHVAYYTVSPEDAELIANEDVFGTSFVKDSEIGGAVDIFLRLKSAGRDYNEVAFAIGDKYNHEDMSLNVELLGLEGVIAQDSVMRAFILIAAIAIGIIIAGSVIVISNAFYISASERVRQFGLLKSAGATKSQIGRSIFLEAILLEIVAVPLGIGLGFLIQAVVLLLVNGLLSEMMNLIDGQKMIFRVVFSPEVIYITVIVALITLLISAWFPARKVVKTSPIDAIRQTQDIRIRSKQLKTPRLIGKLFGFEGTLAAKSLKRNRGKYRATVVSLTVSIVLFVSISFFIQMMNESVQVMYGDMDFDVIVGVSGDWEKLEHVESRLSTLPDAEMKHMRWMYVDTVLPEGFVTGNARGSASDQKMVVLYAVPDDEFSAIDAGENAAILINTTGAYKEDSKIKQSVPYDCEIGTELPFTFTSEQYTVQNDSSVKIAAITSKVPSSISTAFFDGEMVNVLVSESFYKTMGNADSPFAIITVDTSSPDEFCAEAAELLEPESYEFIENVSAITRISRNIEIIVGLFGYGFIAMLSFIAVTSVIATISTGIALRRQEFAMLYSAGMTQKGMNKMLNLESLLYGLKSILIGLPVGIALSYMIYYATTGVVEMNYSPPYGAMLISAAAVLLLTFATMRYSKRRLNMISIVEALRSETA